MTISAAISVLPSLFVAVVVVAVTPVSCDYDYYYDQKPLFLTPLLETGEVEKARNLSSNKVNGVAGYSGYFTVDKGCGSHLFAWFFPAARGDWREAPLLLWLNGGPGSTSMYGLFSEIGPWNYMKGRGFVPNAYAWTEDHNVIFFDQPVGTGYSFTEHGCYVSNLTVSTAQLHLAIVQFFGIFPELRKNAFYLTGESFAGHYLPLLAMEIDLRNRKAESPIRLAGVFIGNGFMEPACFDRSDFMYEIGAVDNQLYRSSLADHRTLVEALQKGDLKEASEIIGLMSPFLPNDYNILYDEKEPDFLSDFQLFVKDIKTRDLLHVGYTPFMSQNNLVYNLLKEAMVTSRRGAYEYLLLQGRFPLVFFTGQLDSICGVTQVACSLRNLNWPGAYDYMTTRPEAWVQPSGRVAGWYKSVGPMMEIVVRNAGHFVPTDQGEFALHIIMSVIANTRRSVEQPDKQTEEEEEE